MNDTVLAEAGIEPTEDEASVLAVLRAELDDIDDGVHDLLMRRAEVVRQVAARKAAGAKAGRLRPGREAAIARRLLARHAGPLPAVTVLRIWRELLAGSVAVQGAFSIAVCDAEPGRPIVQAAREQFGALTPLAVHASPLHAIGAVSSGAAVVAVLPVPREDDAPRAAWWPALLHRDDPRMHVIARLPFWSVRPDGAPTVQAFAVAAMPPDPSGDDRSLIGLELPPETSLGRVGRDLAEAGFSVGPLIIQRDAGGSRVLADVVGFVDDDDPRLRAVQGVTQAPVVLGAYASPVG